jgi:hypothetical protein
MKETGNVGAPENPLTDLEEMLLDLTRKVVVYGLNNVPDIGWENKENEKTKPAVLVVTSAEPIPGTTGKGKSCLYHIPSSTLNSHKLQPFDKTFMGPLKACYSDLVKNKQQSRNTV